MAINSHDGASGSKNEPVERRYSSSVPVSSRVETGQNRQIAYAIIPETGHSWLRFAHLRSSGSSDPLGLADQNPQNYTRPDAFILDDVAKTLAWDPLVDSSDLNIACEGGIVHITGTLPLQAARQRLETLLASIFGIRELSVDAVTVSKSIPPPNGLRQSGEAEEEESGLHSR